ncbi:MAG TPA: Rid family detoxifying hydrolase [Rhodothermales bacterium]|nr:Rid family detoxifying hydrolase [Rhodothermales bacterium]
MKSILSPTAPAPGGPYAHAVEAGALVFCSGQTAVDPATRTLIDGDVAAQTRQALDNVARILDAAGLTLRDVAKTTVYLRNMGDFAAMNAAYADVFGAHRPARTTIGVAELPGGAQIEIECIAVRSGLMPA